ncbi:RNA-binding protein [Brevundimonas sp.]|uniref:RNA-binding protein n=1 Tax=Brevundimonas sp. TaxID=1871086 RepID=UPI002737D026|nr:RNA-binding protein [Brevundimonas sp.]MDP3801590.1 RNA-binding protein [Brevundimonas sp.]
MSVEVFLDDTPGEVRGVIARDGRFEHLLIQRDDDVAEHRLGARCVGRIAEVHPGLKGGFVDLDALLFGFLPFRGQERLAVGQKVEVEVSAEPREGKGPTLRLIGPGQGAPRLVAPGPTVAETLARLAPGVEPATGLAAIQASWDAEEEAGWPGEVFADTGLDVMVQRTRALIAVDLDLAPAPGVAFGAPARTRANRQGLFAAARMIRLKRWGGLVAIDLLGTGQDGDVVMAAAKQAFGGDPEVVFGPVNRFGVLQLALPWRLTPLEEVLSEPGGRRRAAQRAQDAVRSLRHSLLSDTATARVTLRCAPDEAALAAPLVAKLGPRAHLIADPAIGPGAFTWREG